MHVKVALFIRDEFIEMNILRYIYIYIYIYAHTVLNGIDKQTVNDVRVEHCRLRVRSHLLGRIHHFSKVKHSLQVRRALQPAASSFQTWSYLCSPDDSIITHYIERMTRQSGEVAQELRG